MELTDAKREQIRVRIFGKDGKSLDREMLAIYVAQFKKEQQEADFAQAIDLWKAGWTSELPDGKPAEVMSWYWRRPPIGTRKQGRQYRSTSQAWVAMMEDKACA